MYNRNYKNMYNSYPESSVSLCVDKWGSILYQRGINEIRVINDISVFMEKYSQLETELINIIPSTNPFNFRTPSSDLREFLPEDFIKLQDCVEMFCDL